MSHINVSKLHLELELAGLSVRSCSDDGRVIDLNGKEIQDTPQVKAIIQAHSPNETKTKVTKEDINDGESKIIETILIIEQGKFSTQDLLAIFNNLIEHIAYLDKRIKVLEYR